MAHHARVCEMHVAAGMNTDVPLQHSRTEQGCLGGSIPQHQWQQHQARDQE